MKTLHDNSISNNIGLNGKIIKLDISYLISLL